MLILLPYNNNNAYILIHLLKDSMNELKRTDIETYIDWPCPHCGQYAVTKAGWRVLSGGRRKQRYRCTVCGRTFYRPEVAA